MDLQNNPTRKIHLLPEHIVDQIKAGEVVERPSALLKELIENSVDAGSNRIDLQIRDNGLELISVEDDGQGMDKEDLPYAFCRHATSKITQFDDLYNLHSYGFRGEALASISSISRITCTSSPKSDPTRGGKIVFHGGKQEDWSSLPSTTNGTSFFVKDLFYNTPARLKFLKSKTAEKNALQRVINAFILTQPKISFSIKWDDKEKQLFPPCKKEDIKKRVAGVFFKKKATTESLGQIIEVNNDYEGTKLRGFYSTSTTKGAAGKAHYFFVNGRLFVDKVLHQAFMRTAQRVWPQGEFGHYCFYIDLPPDQVDVNVHPGKIHVKFLKPSVIFGLISNCVEKTDNFESFDYQKEDNQFSTDSIWNSYKEIVSGESASSSQAEVNYGKSFFELSEKHLLLRKEDQVFLVDLNLFLRSFLEDKFSSNSNQSSTPILIGEAFKFSKGSIDKKLNILAEYGFELDRVDEETLILRTIHSDFALFNLNELVLPFLEFIDHNSSFDLKLALDSIEAKLYKTIRGNRFESLWNKVEKKNPKSIVELDHQVLQDLFESKR